MRQALLFVGAVASGALIGVGCNDKTATDSAQPAAQSANANTATPASPIGSAASGSEPGSADEQKAADETGAEAETVERILFSKSEIPTGIAVQGDLINGLRFNDENGDNWVIFSKKVTHPVLDDPSFVSQFLYAVHYVRSGAGALRLLRRVQDKIEECTTTYQLTLDEGPLGVTDLDEDGVGEVMFGYRMVCAQEDPAPHISYGYKLLMLEDGDKYIIRGAYKQTSDTEVKLRKTVDKSLRSGPPAFLTHANARWEAITRRVFDAADWSNFQVPSLPGGQTLHPVEPGQEVRTALENKKILAFGAEYPAARYCTEDTISNPGDLLIYEVKPDSALLYHCPGSLDGVTNVVTLFRAGKPPVSKRVRPPRSSHIITDEQLRTTALDLVGR